MPQKNEKNVKIHRICIKSVLPSVLCSNNDKIYLNWRKLFHFYTFYVFIVTAQQ